MQRCKRSEDVQSRLNFPGEKAPSAHYNFAHSNSGAIVRCVYSRCCYDVYYFSPDSEIFKTRLVLQSLWSSCDGGVWRVRHCGPGASYLGDILLLVVRSQD